MVATGTMVGGCLALFIGCSISSAGGVGGGGINVPILLIIFGYSFDDCVTFSLCIVLGNALAQSMINIRKIHPTSIRSPLVFWELVVILLPAQMGGSNIGSLLSDIFPVSVLYIIAFVVLFYASTVSLKKGLHKWHDETALKENISRQSLVNKLQSDLEVGGSGTASPTTVVSPMAPSETISIHENSMSISAPSSFHIQDKGQSEEDGDLNITLQEQREDHFRKSHQSTPVLPRIMEVGGVVNPVLVMQVVGAIWVVYTALVVALVKVTPCSSAYAAIFVVLYVPLNLTIFWGIYYNTRLAPTLIPPGLSAPVPPANDLDFDKIKYTLPCAACLIGVICSLLGIGGGELFGPLMLSYGVVPQVSSATTSVLSLLNTSSNIIRSAVKGDIEVKMGAIFFFIGATGGAVGRQFGLFVSARYGRPSVIILALVVALYLTCLYYIYQLASSSFDASLSSFC